MELAEVTEIVTKLYLKRYFILLMFVLLSASNSMQWIEYSIIAHIITDYYNVSYSAVDWTSMIYMATYMIFIFPGSWILNRFGLRFSILIGAFGNCFGSWLKTISVSPDMFWLTFIGQTIVGLSQVFILGIPPRLAAIWFGSNEVSTACAIGVFGNQLGIAIGFLIPPWIVHVGTKASVTTELRNLFIIFAILTTIIFIIIFIFFSERPLLPPSLAQTLAIEQSVDKHFFLSIKQLFFNKNYLILLISYGINVGVFYAISTLLSQMIKKFYSDVDELVGTIGLLIVLSGMIGSILCGYILDKFHFYKLTILIVYLFSFISMIFFTFIIGRTPLWTVFIIAFILGFFMTGYLPLGFELAAELTFPIAESTTSGLLNASAQFFGIIMTFAIGKIISLFSIFCANSIMSFFLLIGLCLTALIQPKLRRRNAHREIKN